MLSAVSRGFREARSVSRLRLSYFRRGRVIRLESAHVSGEVISGVATIGSRVLGGVNNTWCETIMKGTFSLSLSLLPTSSLYISRVAGHLPWEV